MKYFYKKLINSLVVVISIVTVNLAQNQEKGFLLSISTPPFEEHINCWFDVGFAFQFNDIVLLNPLVSFRTDYINFGMGFHNSFFFPKKFSPLVGWSLKFYFGTDDITTDNESSDGKVVDEFLLSLSPELGIKQKIGDIFNIFIKYGYEFLPAASDHISPRSYSFITFGFSFMPYD